MKAGAWIKNSGIKLDYAYVTAKCYHLERSFNTPYWKTTNIRKTESGGLYLEGPWSDALHWSRMYEYPLVYFQLIGGSFRNNDSIMDAGGGRSVFQYFLAQELPEATIHNIDLTVEYVEDVQKIINKHNFKNLSVRQGDMLNLLRDYHENSFDHVICVSVLEHVGTWEDRINIAKQMLQVARKSVTITMDVICKFQPQANVYVPDPAVWKFTQELGVSFNEDGKNVIGGETKDLPANERIMVAGLRFEK